MSNRPAGNAVRQPMAAHTTEDELAFLRRLESEGKRRELKLYRKSLPHRVFSGQGMAVNRSIIIRELNRMLGREPEEERSLDYYQYAGEVASEYLGGGHLRNVARKRVLAGNEDF